MDDWFFVFIGFQFFEINAADLDDVNRVMESIIDGKTILR